MPHPYRAPVALRAIVVAAGLVVAAAIPAAAQSAAAPATSAGAQPDTLKSAPPHADTLPRVTVRAPSGMSDSLRVELAGHIADSATLAAMSPRERVLRLMSDNRYLEHVRRDQDRRIDELERRIKELAAERRKARSKGVPATE